MAENLSDKLYVVYDGKPENPLDAEILLTTEDRQAAIAQAQEFGGIVYAYDNEGEDLLNETFIYDGRTR